MKSGHCPQCGAHNVRARKGNMGAYGVNSIPLGGSGLFSLAHTTPLDTYVCIGCGYVESYISDRHDLNLIAETWPTVR